jgi:hypothetical protein
MVGYGFASNPPYTLVALWNMFGEQGVFLLGRAEKGAVSEGVIPGRCVASNPESRDSGFALSRAPE